jgi:16S rRNA processing protein RimM
LLNPGSQALAPGIKVQLRAPQSSPLHPVEMVIATHRSGIITFEGINDRNAAEKLSGLEIWIRRSDLPETKPGELYLADLMGFKAEDIQGNLLGEVTGFSDNGPQILVEVSGKMLIPMVKPLWVSVDETAGKLIFDLPEGYE